MMLKSHLNFFWLLALLSSTTFTTAQGEPHQHNNEHDHPTVEVAPNTKPIQQDLCADQVIAKVNGLVCDFCAQALQKVFSQRAEVAGIDVNLDSGQVKIQFNPGEHIQQTELSELITHSGYNVVSYENGCEQ